MANTVTEQASASGPQLHALTSSWGGETYACSCSCGAEDAQRVTADEAYKHRSQAAEAAFAQMSTVEAAAMVELHAQGGDYRDRLAMGILLAEDPAAGVPNWVAGDFRLRPYAGAFYHRSGELWAGLVWANIRRALDAGELAVESWTAEWDERILRVALSVVGEGAVKLSDLLYLHGNEGVLAALEGLVADRPVRAATA